MDIKSTGLPHSEISGSRVICTSPELVAACHVLLRLREPRHPPVALFFFFLSMNARTSLLSYSDLKRSKFVRVVFCCVSFRLLAETTGNAVKSTLL